MEKRGQVTTFIIVGIVLLLALAFIFFAKNTIIEGISGKAKVQSYLRGVMDNIKTETGKCVEKEARSAINILGKNGGYFEPKAYVEYYGEKISFSCANIPNDKRCLNNMLSKTEMEERMKEYLMPRIKKCTNLAQFEPSPTKLISDYKLIYDPEAVDLQVTINRKNVLLNLTMPVAIERADVKFLQNSFFKGVGVPFGDMVYVANDILNAEASVGDFSTLSYDLFSLNKYEIRRNLIPFKPFHKIYTVKENGYDYEFKFAVESE